MPITVTRYRCAICLKEYDTEEEALACEGRGAPLPFPVGTCWLTTSGDFTVIVGWDIRQAGKGHVLHYPYWMFRGFESVGEDAYFIEHVTCKHDFLRWGITMRHVQDMKYLQPIDETNLMFRRVKELLKNTPIELTILKELPKRLTVEEWVKRGILPVHSLDSSTNPHSNLECSYVYDTGSITPRKG